MLKDDQSQRKLPAESCWTQAMTTIKHQPTIKVLGQIRHSTWGLTHRCEIKEKTIATCINCDWVYNVEYNSSSLQYRATVGPPEKRHLNGDGGPMVARF